MSRSRITITIKNELLDNVDAFIDGTRIKNRSHAIESILSREFSGRLRTAVVLAGGEALKGQEETSRIFAEYRGKPLIEHTLSWLRWQGIEELIMCGNGYSAGIRKNIGDGSRFGIKISYVDKDEGTANVLTRIANRLDGTFLMMNGDVLAELDISEMLDFHRKCRGLCTVGMISVREPAAFGNIILRGNRIMDFIEKPKAGKEESYLVNAGIYIMDSGILNKIFPGCRSLEKDLFPAIAKAKEDSLYGYYIQDKWISVDDFMK